MGISIRIHQDTGGGGISGVDSFNGRIGVVVSQGGDYTTAQVMETPNKNYVTDAEKIAISNTTGTNTGDETPLSVKTKYESNTNTNVFTDVEKTKVTNLSGTNTGDETTLSIQTKRPLKTVEGQSLEGVGDLSIDIGVASFNGRTGVVIPVNGDYTTAQVTESTDKNYVTDAESTVITNTSGTNTGDETTLSIQTKRPLKTVNGNSLEGIGDVPISGFDPVAEGVLTDYESSQDDTVSTTSSTAGVTYINLNTSGATIGEPYKFTLAIAISHSATNSNAFIDVKDFGVSVLNQIYTVEPKDNSNRIWVNLSGEILPNTLGAGQFQIQLDYGTDDAADTTTVYFAYLALQKVN